jgi:hypothetical protein
LPEGAKHFIMLGFRKRETGESMQKAVIIQSNGSGKDKLDGLLEDGWLVLSVTPNDGNSYNDFLVILERK